MHRVMDRRLDHVAILTQSDALGPTIGRIGTDGVEKCPHDAASPVSTPFDFRNSVISDSVIVSEVYISLDDS